MQQDLELTPTNAKQPTPPLQNNTQSQQSYQNPNLIFHPLKQLHGED